MAELKWTKWMKVSVCLLLGLHFTAAAGRSPYLTVSQGYVTILPCYTNRAVFDNCYGTTWTFSQPGGPSVNLVERGKKKDRNKGPNRKSISLSVRCSLVLLGVRVEDAGLYICKQSIKSRQQQVQAPPVYLSVVTVDEQKDKDMTSLSCSVVPLQWCQHRVHWLYDDRKGGNIDMEDVYQSCKTTVSFNTSHLQDKSKYKEFFSCHVTNANNKELQINFAPQVLEERTAVANGYETTTQQAPTHYSALTPMMLVMRIAEVIFITAIIVFIIRTQVNQKPTDDNTVPETVKDRTEMRSGPEASQVQNNGDELYATVNYENSSVTLH